MCHFVCFQHVSVLDVDFRSGESLQAKLSSEYGASRIKFYKCDITSNDLEDAYESILKEFEYIDVVVNCAGIMNDEKNVYLKEIAVNVVSIIIAL